MNETMSFLTWMEVSRYNSRLPLTSSVNWICSTYPLRTAYLDWFWNTQQISSLSASISYKLEYHWLTYFIQWYNLRFRDLNSKAQNIIPYWIGYPKKSGHESDRMNDCKMSWLFRFLVCRNMKTVSIKYSRLQGSSWILSHYTFAYDSEKKMCLLFFLWTVPIV